MAATTLRRLSLSGCPRRDRRGPQGCRPSRRRAAGAGLSTNTKLHARNHPSNHPASQRAMLATDVLKLYEAEALQRMAEAGA